MIDFATLEPRRHPCPPDLDPAQFAAQVAAFVEFLTAIYDEYERKAGERPEQQ